MAEDTIELPDGLDLDTAKDVLREFATTDEAQIVSSDVLEAKDEKIDELAGVFRDALTNQRGLKEATVDGMTVDALTAEFRDGDGSDGYDTLSGDVQSEVKEKLRRADLMESRTPDHADTLRSDAANLAGVDDWETLAAEVDY